MAHHQIINHKISYKMELGPILVGLVTVLLIVAPIVYLHKSQKNKDKIFEKAFMAIAENNKLIITEKEFWNINFGIGIDAQAKKLVYLKKTNEKEINVVVDLQEYDKCRVSNRSRTVKTSAGSSSVIDRLDLVFVNKNPQKSEKSIEFYNGEESLCLRGELPLIEKWCEKVNIHINNSKKTMLV